tara:strand:- start:1418 stop:1804 length:387 start_codon:yes stop_codon:yes gene_type:complete
MKTIAQQLKIKDFPFFIKDKDGNNIYCENSNGLWWKSEYDVNGKEIYWKNSNGFCTKSEYDANHNEIRYEDSTGFWRKKEYDAHGNEIRYETSLGVIVDKRPKQVVEVTLEDIASKLGISVEQLRIKD